MHKNILDKWDKDTEIGIVEYCTNSEQEDAKIFESFLITFMKNYQYNLANIKFVYI